MIMPGVTILAGHYWNIDIDTIVRRFMDGEKFRDFTPCFLGRGGG
jgi:hypothetical protein